MLATVRLGRDPAAERSAQRMALTISGLIDAFIAEHVEPKLKARTGEAHRSALQILNAAYGGLKVETLSRGQIAALHSKMREHPFAANRAVAVWGKLFAWAAPRGLVPEGYNPARGIERYREPGRDRFLTREELSALGDVLRDAESIGLPWDTDEEKAGAKHLARPAHRRTVLDPFAVAAVRLLILTGARLREVLHLQWEQIDTERGIAFLSDSKSGRKPLFLSGPAQAVLSSLPRLGDNRYVIAGANAGAPRADLKRPWCAIARCAGLEHFRIHDLRHSFASVGAGASLGLPIIGKLLGHSQSQTTARYAHLDADPMHRAAETIGAAIAAAMGDASPEGADVVPFSRSRARG
jgi:integrase